MSLSSSSSKTSSVVKVLRYLTVRELDKSLICPLSYENWLLGALLFESKGKITGQRVLSVENGNPKLEVSITGTGIFTKSRYSKYYM
jgi:hypothetical protein